MIEVECECGRVVKTRDENAGKKAKCPDCGEIVQFPAPRRSASKSAVSKGAVVASVKPTKRKAADDDEEFNAPDGDDEFDFDPDEAELPKAKTKKTAKRAIKATPDAEEPAPKKKKKKQKSDEQNGDLNKNIVIGTCVVFGLAFLGMVGFLIVKLPSATSGPKVEVPTEFVNFSTENGELRCQAPKGWDAKSGGGSGGVPPHATFERGNVKIQFRSSPSGASFQMIAQAGQQNPNEIPDELKPVSKVHDIQREKYVQEMSGYEEQGPPEMIKTPGGEARLSAFTASEGFSKIFGYRVTMLGTNNQWNVICKCSASQWKDFQPVFRKVVASAQGT